MKNCLSTIFMLRLRVMLKLFLINLFVSSNPQQFNNLLKVYTMTTARFIVFSEEKGGHHFAIRVHKMTDDHPAPIRSLSIVKTEEHLNNIPVRKKSVMLKKK